MNIDTNVTLLKSKPTSQIIILKIKIIVQKYNDYVTDNTNGASVGFRAKSSRHRCPTKGKSIFKFHLTQIYQAYLNVSMRDLFNI